MAATTSSSSSIIAGAQCNFRYPHITWETIGTEVFSPLTTQHHHVQWQQQQHQRCTAAAEYQQAGLLLPSSGISSSSYMHHRPATAAARHNVGGGNIKGASASMMMVRLTQRYRDMVCHERARRGHTQESLAGKLYLQACDVRALEQGRRPVLRHVAEMVLFSLNIQVPLDWADAIIAPGERE